MKLLAIALAAVSLALAAIVAVAAPTQTLGLGAGISIPVGDWADLAGSGYHVGGCYCYDVSSEFGVGLDVGYHALGEVSASAALGGTTLSAKLKTRTLQASALVRLYLPVQSSRTAPYLRAGLGLYNLNQTGTVVVSGDLSDLLSMSGSESKLGFNFGAGVRIGSGDRSALGLEAVYHVLAGSVGPAGLSGSPSMVTVGVNYQFLLAR